MGSTGSLTYFLLALVSGMCNGAGLVVAQCFGCGNKERLAKTVTALIWVAGALACIMAGVGLFGAEFFLRLLSVPEDVMPYSVTYLHIKLYINEKNRKGHIRPELYGNFSEHLGRCIYEGVYVGENSEIPNTRGMRKDVVEALKEMKLPVLRWPGGCFADEYHWKDGIGPKENRKKMINTHWGGVTEDNRFGTHEFFDLCEQIGCKTYINGNVGSGSVQEMSEWVEYMTFDGVSPMADLRRKNGREKAWKVDYFGVGNENWGCGGNMTPSYYGNLYRRYQTYVRNYDRSSRFLRCAADRMRKILTGRKKY